MLVYPYLCPTPTPHPRSTQTIAPQSYPPPPGIQSPPPQSHFLTALTTRFHSLSLQRNNSAFTISLSPQSARSLVAYLRLSTASSRADDCHQVTPCAPNHACNLSQSSQTNMQLNSHKPCPSTRLPSEVGVDSSLTPMRKTDSHNPTCSS